MIILLQKVLKSSCTVDGKVTGESGNGLLLFVCAERIDTPATVKAAANKVLKYRVFQDANGKMNLSALDVGADILVVPQFTLAADTNSGTRPSLSLGASPEVGKKYFEQFVEEIKRSGLKTGQGVFGAHMEISLVNDGPVTFWLQVPRKPRRQFMEDIFRMWSDSFADGQRIPEVYAFAKIDHTGKEHTLPGGDRNPELSWDSMPPGTNSLILLCQDHDVPADFSDANQEGKTIPKDAPRTTFNHWVLVDISPEVTNIPAGSLANGIVAHGKPGPACANGMRQGLNDYTKSFEGDSAMHGKYYGYDGPCPPWNDERVHKYHFTLYAVDFPMLPLQGSFTADEVLKAMEGHVLGQCTVMGTYTLNPELKKAK